LVAGGKTSVWRSNISGRPENRFRNSIVALFPTVDKRKTLVARRVFERFVLRRVFRHFYTNGARPKTADGLFIFVVAVNIEKMANEKSTLQVADVTVVFGVR